MRKTYEKLCETHAGVVQAMGSTFAAMLSEVRRTGALIKKTQIPNSFQHEWLQMGQSFECSHNDPPMLASMLTRPEEILRTDVHEFADSRGSSMLAQAGSS